jgi:hypothetical protein
LVDFEEFARAISAGSILDLAHICENWAPVGTTDTLSSTVTGVVLMPGPS